MGVGRERRTVGLPGVDAVPLRDGVAVAGGDVQHAGLVVDDRLTYPHRTAVKTFRDHVGLPQDLAGAGVERHDGATEGRGHLGVLGLRGDPGVDNSVIDGRGPRHESRAARVGLCAPEHRAGTGIDADFESSAEVGGHEVSGTDDQFTIPICRARPRGRAGSSGVVADVVGPDSLPGFGVDGPELATPVRYISNPIDHRCRRGDIARGSEGPFRL